jgi:hypothetical protein
MRFDRNQFLMLQEERALYEAAARTGLALADIRALVECELETPHLLDYIDAVVSRQMN